MDEGDDDLDADELHPDVDAVAVLDDDAASPVEAVLEGWFAALIRADRPAFRAAVAG